MDWKPERAGCSRNFFHLCFDEIAGDYLSRAGDWEISCNCGSLPLNAGDLTCMDNFSVSKLFYLNTNLTRKQRHQGWIIFLLFRFLVTGILNKKCPMTCRRLLCHIVWSRNYAHLWNIFSVFLWTNMASDNMSGPTMSSVHLFASLLSPDWDNMWWYSLKKLNALKFPKQFSASYNQWMVPVWWFPEHADVIHCVPALALMLEHCRYSVDLHC